MPEKFKVAFVGFRHDHIFGLYTGMKESEQYEIVAACEENTAAAEAAAANGVEITHNDFHEMMQQVEFDILAIGDYYAIRGSRAISAMVAGKHVIADKPLCTSLAELREIRHLAQTRNLKVGCMLDMRLHGNVNAAKEFIDSGKLGEIHAISFGGQHPLSYGVRPNWYFEPGKHGGTSAVQMESTISLVAFSNAIPMASPNPERIPPSQSNNIHHLAKIEDGHLWQPSK